MSYTGGEHGVMSAIMSMTAPPTFGSQDSLLKGNKQDKSGNQKKANRAPIKELLCDGCGDTGEVLLSCVTCGVNYHPICDDPSLDEDSVKDLEWKCRSCRYKESIAPKLPEAADLEIVDCMESESQETCDVKPDIASLALDLSPEPLACDTESVPLSEEEGIVLAIKNIFHRTIENGKSLNPTPYEMPKSFFKNHYQFPGTSRSVAKKASSGKLRPTIVELENSMVPRPITTCFSCNKSCRIGPLLKCDYCPTYFHFDCLNPPLTAPPVGLWICPLHPEPFLESKRLMTWQLSERMRLWDLTENLVDRNAVILNFMEKCQRKNPPFSVKIAPAELHKYKPPKHSAHVGVRIVSESQSGDGIIQFTSEDRSNLEEDKEIETDLAEIEMYNCYSSKFYNGAKRKVQETDEKEQAEEASIMATNISLTSEKDGETNETQGNDEFVRVSTEETAINSTEANGDNENKSELQSLTVSERQCGPSFFEGVDMLLTASDQLSSEKERRLRYLKKLSFDQVYDLAAMKLEEFDFAHAAYNYKSYGPIKKASVEQDSSAVNSKTRKVARRAIELFCLNMPKLIRFESDSVIFGKSKGQDQYGELFNPKIFVNCKRISSYHAVLYFDRCYERWEILNYSPYGIIVDSIQYSLNDAANEEPVAQNELEVMKNRILKHRNIRVKKSPSCRVTKQKTSCACEMASSTTVLEVKHEGSAVLTVGSEIQIGCLKLMVRGIDVFEEVIPDPRTVSVT